MSKPIQKSIREALALAAALERLSNTRGGQQNGINVHTWIGNISKKWYARLSCGETEKGANDGYETAIESILAAVEKMEKKDE